MNPKVRSLLFAMLGGMMAASLLHVRKIVDLGFGFAEGSLGEGAAIATPACGRGAAGLRSSRLGRRIRSRGVARHDLLRLVRCALVNNRHHASFVGHIKRIQSQHFQQLLAVLVTFRVPIFKRVDVGQTGIPQLPQFPSSVCWSTQVPKQLSSSAAQQTPLSQTSPGPQTIPQPPQWSAIGCLPAFIAI